MNTRFAFSAVIGCKEDVQNEDNFRIRVEVIYDGQQIHSNTSFEIRNSASLDHVWLHYHGSLHSHLKTDSLRVKFMCVNILGNPSKSGFFKSCGFHLEHTNI